MKFEENIPSVQEYPAILEDLYKFINNYQDNDDYLPEVILEFCFKRDYPVELIADVVSADSSFKLALELNCKSSGTFKSKSTNFVDW